MPSAVQHRGPFERYNTRVDDAHSKMIWTHPGMDTYYRNARGRVVTNMPWRVVDYWHMAHSFDADDFTATRAATSAGAWQERPVDTAVRLGS